MAYFLGFEVLPLGWYYSALPVSIVWTYKTVELRVSKGFSYTFAIKTSDPLFPTLD